MFVQRAVLLGLRMIAQGEHHHHHHHHCIRSVAVADNRTIQKKTRKLNKTH